LGDDRLPPADRISVLLVDDHALVRGGFRRLLEDDPAIAVVGEVSDADAAVRLALELKPTVVVMDYALPGENGLVAMQRIRRALPDIAVLMLSMRDEEPIVREALDSGARGFVVKDASDFDLARAVRRVAEGQTVVSPRLISAPTPARPGADRLSRREREVLQLLCRGLSARAIAAELGLSVFTVRVYRANIMRTLDIHRTTALVAYAVQHGLVDPL
jgi:DNA-binding NarL/FixJ family response regulator